jgi:hypothetical protein
MTGNAKKTMHYAGTKEDYLENREKEKLNLAVTR